MRFSFIEEHEQSFEVTDMCQTFEVSRSGYYAWKQREPGTMVNRNTPNGAQ